MQTPGCMRKQITNYYIKNISEADLIIGDYKTLAKNMSSFVCNDLISDLKKRGSMSLDFSSVSSESNDI